jgi:hypothetical protein
VPTTYTGDQTQTQLPSDPPEGENGIQVALPADGDGNNAATYEQAFKVLADFIDFLKRPKGTAGVWEKCIVAFRAAIGHRRFAIDHLGFPTGQVLAYDATWPFSPLTGYASHFNTGEFAFGVAPEWTYKGVGTSGVSEALFGVSTFGAPTVAIRPGDTLNDYVTLKSGPIGRLRADNHTVLEFSATVPANGEMTCYIGLAANPSSTVAAESNFIGFRIPGGGTWRCVTKAAGVQTETNSGVAASIGASRLDRLRVEWSGETVADDATRAVRFYINGALVATHLTNLPLDLTVGPVISDIRTTAAVGGEYLLVGPMRFRMSLSEVDTVL